MGNVRKTDLLESLAVVPFTCSCGKFYHVADDSQGHQIRCPFCYELQDVPAPPKSAPRSPWRVRIPRFFSWPGQLLFAVMLMVPIGGPMLVWLATNPSRLRAAAQTQIAHYEESRQSSQEEPKHKIKQEVGSIHSANTIQPINLVSRGVKLAASPRPRMPEGPITPEQRAVYEHLVKYASVPESVEVIEWMEPRSVDPNTSCEPFPYCNRAVHATVREMGFFGTPVVYTKLFYLTIIPGKEIFVWGGINPFDIRYNHEMGAIYRDRDPDPLGTQIRHIIESPRPRHDQLPIRRFDPSARR